MAYAVLADVQARMPQFPLTGTTKPTSTDAAVMLTDVEAEFDACLTNLGYVTPITGVKSLRVAKTIICAGAIAKILFARSAAVGGDIAVQSATRASAEYKEYLTNLADPKYPLELVDAARNEDRVDKPNRTLNGLLTDEDGNDLEPRATMDQVF